MKTKDSLLAAKKNNSCKTKTSQWQTLSLGIKLQKAQISEAKKKTAVASTTKLHLELTSEFPKTLTVQPTSHLEKEMNFKSDTSRTNVHLPMAFQANQQPLFTELVQHISMHLQPSKSAQQYTQTDPATRIFRSLLIKVFTLRTTIPSERIVNDHMKPTKHQHLLVKAISNSVGETSQNVLNVSFLHFSNPPYSTFNRGRMDHICRSVQQLSFPG
jgi:hypothetical protein